ncbi:MAG TPA: 4Fe-4S dicluster domain-containing protein, partial [Polyangia bacterium]|nr:4Fe-4S dicluster domain-containing protein [Polyangia bacterium]
RFPELRAAFHDPLDRSAATAGAALAFGRPLLPQLDLARADAIVSLDADFLCELPFSVRYARQWATRRRITAPGQTPSRLAMVESQLSVTGSMADDRLRRPLARVPQVARSVAARLALPGSVATAARAGGEDPETARWADAVARDLRDRPRGTTLVLAGDRQPAAIHALTHVMNAALGNLGQTLTFTDPVLPQPGGAVQTFDELVGDMRAGRVDTLLILDSNPVYTAPADFGFGVALSRVAETICLAYYEHETARRCRWFAPAQHFLEAWGDGRAYDGTISMIQPIIEPLVDARGAGELLAALAGEPQPDARRLAHDFWTRQRGLSETEWQRAVQRGVQPETAAPGVDVHLQPPAVAQAVASLLPNAGEGGLAVELYSSPTVHDGRFANNPWLLEQPAPIGKLTWDNAALMSPATVQRLGVEDGRVIELRAPAATVRAPVLTIPGMADGVAGVWLGYGRTGQERNAAGVGFNAYPLRTRDHLHSVPGVAVTATADRHDLALTQEHWSTHDRPIALRRTLADYRRDPDFAARYRAPAPSLMPEFPYQGNQWAMSIDLSICTGCSSCTVACQAENNLLTVGKDGVLKSREMNWLRIDTYFFGPPEAPRLVHQPMMCQHCEKAPCEYVCPVEATVHSPDGLNEMIYNR